jgi:hypothetical protein
MSTYDYERLGPELFQELCQALLVREYKNVQCLPVGMPDGGRDALTTDDSVRGKIIFQVKLNRIPKNTSDIVKWVTDTIDGEAEKVEVLVDRGASQYVLICNVPGTSHPEVGRIDRVQEYLQSRIKVPAMCWWREDLDRRLDGAYDLKLRYPAILNGPDVVRILWESACRGEAPERRRAALNAYIAHQHSKESTVRFKQIELVSKSLMDLYVDVPAIMARGRYRRHDPIRVEFRAAARRAHAGWTTTDRPDFEQSFIVTTSDGEAYREIDGMMVEIEDVGAADLLHHQIPRQVGEIALGVEFKVRRLHRVRRNHGEPGDAAAFSSSRFTVPSRRLVPDQAGHASVGRPRHRKKRGGRATGRVARPPEKPHQPSLTEKFISTV